jgi:hypothetical protein
LGKDWGSHSAIDSQNAAKFSKDCVAGNGRSRGNVNSHWTLLPECAAVEMKPMLGSS